MLAAFREDINGTNFTVTITHLPAGKYTVTIGEAETLAGAAGERLFDVTSGDMFWRRDFDIFAAAGGARKVCLRSAAWLSMRMIPSRGRLTVSFAASKGTAKFNTFEVKNALGASVGIVQRFGIGGRLFRRRRAACRKSSDPPIWRDPSQPLKGARG